MNLAIALYNELTNIQKKCVQINDSHDPSHHNHPNLVEGDRLQFTSEGRGGVAPLFIQILDALVHDDDV